MVEGASYRADTWTDPATGNIVVAMARQVEGEPVDQALTADPQVVYENHVGTAPALLELDLAEAKALYRALDRAILHHEQAGRWIR